MGDGSKDRKARKRAYKNKVKQGESEPEIEKHSSWSLILGAGIVGVGLAIGGLYSLFHKEDVPVKNIVEPAKLEEKVEDEWGFLKRVPADIKGNDSLEVDDVKRMCVPMGPEAKVREYDEYNLNFFDFLTPDIVRQNLMKAGMNPDLEHEIEFTRQDYGLPDEPLFAEQLLRHVKKSVDFLHDRLPNLERQDVEYVILKTGDNYTHGNNGKVFLGNSYFEMFRARVKDKRSGMPLLTFEKYNHCAGGSCTYSINVVDAEKGKVEFDYSHIFIGTGRSALRSPFSEFIPLGSLEKAMMHNFTKGLDEAMLANEAMSEAISQLLAEEMIKEFNIPNGEKLLKAQYKVMLTKPQYKKVPAAIEWVKKNGIESAFNLYMNNPENFVVAIEKGIKAVDVKDISDRVSVFRGSFESGLEYEVFNEFDKKNALKIAENDLKSATEDGFTYVLEDFHRDMGLSVEKVDIYYQSIEPVSMLLEEKDQEVTKKIIPVVENIISAGLKFWEHPSLIRPDYKIVFPSSIEDVKKEKRGFARDKTVEIYPVRMVGTKYVGKSRFLPSPLWASFDFTRPERGQIKRTYRLKHDMGFGPGIDYLRAPIIWSQEVDSDISRIETPSVELLHLQMSTHTDAAAGKAFIVKAAGTYESLLDVGKAYTQFMNDYIYSEELFVHGLHRWFFEDYVRKHPELDIKVEGLGERMGWDQLDVRKVTEKIKKIGVKKAIDNYIRNPLWIKE
ncbi:MAG: hypothetical protein V3V78_03565 [Candidatus Woesearchaeota archaeon]